MEEEKALLIKFDGCLKCCKPFVYHKGSDKAPGCMFPIHTSYKPVTYATITAAMPPNYKAKVASIVPVASDASSSAHPITAVFPGIPNPVDNLASNQSSILHGNGKLDSSVSTSFSPYTVAAIVDPIDTPAVVDTPEGLSAPFSVPHLFWRTLAASADPDSSPLNFDCLIDDGSPSVIPL
jgi:hypothetical protein